MILAAIATASMVSGCVAPDEWIARDRQTCTTIGFKEGSPEYRNCLLQLETARLQGHHHGH